MKKNATSNKTRKLNIHSGEDQSVEYLPFEIKLNVPHSLGELPDYEKQRLIALESTFYAEALFWLMYRFSYLVDNSDQRFEETGDFQNLGFICKIGIALTNRSTEALDRMEIALREKIK